MDNERLVTLAVALVCLFVVGSAAGSLESAVDSSPSEAIDLDYSKLPLDRGEASEIKREYNELTASKDPSPETTEHQSASSGPQETQKSDSGEGESSNSAAKTEQSQGSGGSSPEEQDALDRLIDALIAFLSRLVTFLVALIALVTLALAVRYRALLAERLAPLMARFRDTDPGVEERVSDDADPPATPQNEVTEAWYEMVERLKLDDRRPLTPRELAALARREGADANTVWSLTELFEEVKYGGAPVTDDRRRRAREYVRRLRRTDGVSES